ncbi:MAG: hypothetical protein HQ541_06725, partial [Mariniphaga sp.]|nr:hypothetical protein [Mariniphaga sp.]
CEGMDFMDAEKFKKLWIDQYNYLTFEKECNNILWLFAYGGNPDMNLDLYPGNEYVDIIGLDVYKPSLEGIKEKYDMLQTLNKPFMIAEFGLKGEVGEFDFLNLIEEIKEFSPNTFAIMGWDSKHFTSDENINGKEFMEHPLIITREEIKY